MPEFFNVRSPSQAFEDLRPHLSPISESEDTPTASSLGRVIADEIRSPEDLPEFPRSSMDGFSVRARDTFGASESLPALLEVVADIPTGRSAETTLEPGQATVAYTGGMLADQADAVVMVERTQPADSRSVEVLRPVAPGENVIQAGEDVCAGDLLFRHGHTIRPQDIGGLLALGIDNVPVIRRPKVAIVSTGDELVPPDTRPESGQIRDINTYTIAARVTQCGAQPVVIGLVPDEYAPQLEAARNGIDSADMLVFSAGSSLSSRDMTAAVFNRLGEPGVLLHGISIKPGKPTIVAVADGKPLFGLPGNPVSALVVFDLLVAPGLRVLSGARSQPIANTIDAILTNDIPSESGREDYVPVKLSQSNSALSAEPVFGKSNLIYTLINSDGIIQVPADSGGLYAGAKVSVRLHQTQP